MGKSTDAPLTAAEAEAIATAIALHHHRASQAGGAGGPVADQFGNWAREALYTSTDKSLHRLTAWGHRTWG
ncbi:MAG: hypothetical protein J7513_06085 [Solirubrobacteraceae bacterium]|nr:hypothetical protein [Solirubrobacteraceae bacterium]